MKNFAPHMHNETAQIVDYILKFFLVELAIVFLLVNMQLLNQW